MTLQNALELCLEANQNRGENFVKRYIQSALAELSQTGIFKRWIEIDIDERVVEVDAVEIIKVHGFERVNLSNLRSYNGKKVYMVERLDKGTYLCIGVSSGRKIEAVKGTAKVKVKYCPNVDCMEYCDVLPLPEDIAMGLVERVRESLLNDPQERGRSHSIWKEALAKAYKYASSNADGSDLNIVVKPF